MTDYYCDMSLSSDGVGTEVDPFCHVATGETALGAGGGPHRLFFKRGTSQLVHGEVNTSFWCGNDGWTLGAYGNPADPKPVLNLNVNLHNHTGITIENIKFDATGLTGGSANYNFILDGVESGHTFQHLESVGFQNVLGVTYGSDILVDDVVATVLNCGVGLNAVSLPDPDAIHDMTISNCHFTGDEGQDGITVHDNYPGDYNVGENINIFNNLIDGVWNENCFDFTAYNGGQVYGNTFDGSNAWLVGYFAYKCKDLHFHHNIVKGGYVGATGGVIGIFCDGPLYFYNNFLCANNGNYSMIHIEDSYPGNHSPNNIYIYGNTVLEYNSGYFIRIRDVGGRLGALYFSYNIYTSRTGLMPDVYRFDHSTYKYNDAGFHSGGNVIFDPAHDPHFVDTDGAITWATWTATHTEQSKNDPLLIDRTSGTYTNWYLDSHLSPCYGNASYPTSGTYYKHDGTGCSGLDDSDDMDGTTPRNDIGADELVYTPSTSIGKKVIVVM